MLLLGLETSCDETAAALLRDGEIIADRTTRQLLHEQYGGVVPELASRAHERLLTPAVEGVLKDSGLRLSDIDGVAVTYGPGLAGALLVGTSFAKGLASGLGVPLIGVNHLEGHLWSAELTAGELPLPFLGMIVSGGHTLSIGVERFGEYTLIGRTRDDAVGELFDKVGRMIGFPFPAGPAIDQGALNYDGDGIPFPRARLSDDPFGFSLSGLKTAVLYYLKRRYEDREVSPTQFDLSPVERSAVCAGVMEAVGDMLINGVTAACDAYSYRALVISGGVSASRFLRSRFQHFAQTRGVRLLIPPVHHCTDNGAMIAYAGYRRLRMGESSRLDLSVDPGAELWGTSSLSRLSGIYP